MASTACLASFNPLPSRWRYSLIAWTVRPARISASLWASVIVGFGLHAARSALLAHCAHRRGEPVERRACHEQRDPDGCTGDGRVHGLVPSRWAATR
jgi:hypothetical protein